MATYITTSPIDFTKTVVISFDTNHRPNNFDFGVGICDIEIEGEEEKINLIGEVKLQDYTHIDFDDDIYHQKGNTITFSLLSSKEKIFSDGFIVQKTENVKAGIEYYEESSSTFKTHTKIPMDLLKFEKNDDGFLCINLASGLEKIKEDTVIFEKTDDYANLKENLVVQNNNVYKESKNNEIEAFVLDFGDNTILALDESTFKESDMKYLKDLELLALDYCMTKNLKEESILHTSRIPKIKDANPSFNDGSIIKNSPFDKNQRIRFVISNNGRLMNISLYDKEKKIYDDYLSFTFEKSIDKGYLKVYANSSSNPSNVSTNF